MEKKYRELPFNMENYEDVINFNKYYIDKTLVLAKLADQAGQTFFMLRPRRFGKSLLLSTIRTFFEDERDADGNRVDHRRYFEGKAILDHANDPEGKYSAMLGTLPVIHLKLKDFDVDNFQSAHKEMKEVISSEFNRHDYVLKSDVLKPLQRKKFEKLALEEGEIEDDISALKILSECLYAYHRQKVMILIDEYDVPLEKAWKYGYYEQMYQFLRTFFSKALKGNDVLHTAVVTGCLRVAMESFYTGLNNPTVISILNEEYDEYFGFTEAETAKILSDYDLEDKAEEVKNWYDGYVFGNQTVYNPWSILSYVRDHHISHDADPIEYWMNTSSNEIVKELIEDSEGNEREDLEVLLSGGMIKSTVSETVTYDDIFDSENNIWNFLYFTGYLKKAGAQSSVNPSGTLQKDVFLKIPNLEVHSIYENKIKEWFDGRVKKIDSRELKKMLLGKNTEALAELFGNELFQTISYMDYKEDFYHGFMAGMLKYIPGYTVKSNRESGEGRSDIVLVSNNSDPIIIFEFKQTDSYKKMDELADKALKQIYEKKYDEEYNRKPKAICYGICFCKKELKIVTD